MPKGAAGKERKGLNMKTPTKYASNNGKAKVTAKPAKKA